MLLGYILGSRQKSIFVLQPCQQISAGFTLALTIHIIQVMWKVPGTGDEYPSFAEIGDEIKSVDEKVCTKEIRGTDDHAHPAACFLYTLYRIQSCERIRFFSSFLTGAQFHYLMPNFACFLISLHCGWNRNLKVKLGPKDKVVFGINLLSEMKLRMLEYL